MDEKTLKNQIKKDLKALEFANSQKLSFIDNIKFSKFAITVEPVIVLYLISSHLATVAVLNFRFNTQDNNYAGLTNPRFKGYEHKVPKNSTSESTSYEGATELLSSRLNYEFLFYCFLKLLFVIITMAILCAGAWSDKTGRRRIFLLVPIIGQIITFIFVLNAFNIYVREQNSWIYFSILTFAFSFGRIVLSIGAFSFVADITSIESRTFRTGILGLCLSVAGLVGVLLGDLLKIMKPGWLLLVSACLSICNVIYVYFFIKDHTWQEIKNTKENDGGCMANFLGFQYLKQTLGILFKTGSNKKKLQLFFAVLIPGLLYGSQESKNILLHHYSYLDYTLFLQPLGTLFAIGVLSKIMKVDDSVLGIISILSIIFGDLVMSFMRDNISIISMIVGPFLQIFGETAAIVAVSIASKLVTSKDTGKVFALVFLAMHLMIMAFIPLYNKVDSSVRLPGASYLLNAGVALLVFPVFLFLFINYKKEQKEKKNLEKIGLDSEITS